MTLGQVLREFADGAKVQLLHECLLGARAVNGRGSRGARKGHPAHTRVEFATQNLTVDDVLYFSGGLGRPGSRKPQYVGLVVWIPFEDYDRATSTHAIDPSASDPGTPTPRDARRRRLIGRPK